jgi:succinate dehydrogenase/fumarate reductase flavoprotein subunit
MVRKVKQTRKGYEMGKKIPIDHDRVFGAISRRSFITGAAAAGAVAAAGLAGCSPDDKQSPGANSDGATSAETGGSALGAFLTPPPPIEDSQIADTTQAEVVVIGAGVSGLSAARAAAEEGAQVIVIEKAETWQYRSAQYGCPNSSVMKELGMVWDTREAINQLQKEMGYRADSRLLNRWADEAGGAFDWMVELAGDNLELIPMTALEYDPDKITMQPLHWPPPPAYDIAKEFSPVFPSVITFLPDQGPLLTLVYNKCLELGVEFRFSTRARQLIRPANQGPVQGIICENLDGSYSKILGSKGVVLCGGDWGNNHEMLEYYVPWATRFISFFPNVDAKGEATNTGDCQQMGIWIGAKMEDGPHAPMTHTLGTIVGTDSYSLYNSAGYRFVNEDVGGQQISNQIYRQKDDIAWQVFDDRYPEQLGMFPDTHGNVNFVVPNDEVPHFAGAELAVGKSAFISREEVDNDPTVVKANTLEELAQLMEYSPEAQKTFLEQVARYNELCDQGNDLDFGKDSRRLFPISTAPFYATKMAPGTMLVCMGGLSVDPYSLRVLDSNFNEIEGLYAAGNAMGGRILVDYPVVVAGISHAMALTFGRLAGQSIGRA